MGRTMSAEQVDARAPARAAGRVTFTGNRADFLGGDGGQLRAGNADSIE
jgi:hypothetical protein